jgi:hypothetical protein
MADRLSTDRHTDIAQVNNLWTGIYRSKTGVGLSDL